MKKPLLIVGCIATVLAVDSTSLSKSKGILPNPTISLTRVASSSCGGNGQNTGCHRQSPILTKVEVAVGQRVLNVNGTTAIRVSASNAAVPGARGGLCADVTSGQLIAGANTRTSPSGDALTHVNTFATGRSWSFSYRATQPGLAELFVVSNAADGDGRAGGRDMWNFHSSLIAAPRCTPVRLFVNAAGARSTGPGCDDGYGNHSVLGAATVPTVGNASFTLEAHGLPPAARILLQLSVGGNAVPIDMAPMGASGCVLRTGMQVGISGMSTGGDAVRGEGRAVLPAPIPNQAQLKGLKIDLQVLAMDGNPKRAFPVVVTNGLELTIQ